MGGDALRDPAADDLVVRLAPRLDGKRPVATSEAARSPAAQRNREPIAAVLADWLPQSGAGAGSGERDRASMRLLSPRAFPHLEWQPSDPDPAALTSIEAWRADSGLRQFARAGRSSTPRRRPGRSTSADAVLNINMVHISPWEAALGLLDGAARVLPAGRAADPLRPVAGRGRRDGAVEPGIRCRSQAPQSGLGAAPGRGLRDAKPNIAG